MIAASTVYSMGNGKSMHLLHIVKVICQQVHQVLDPEESDNYEIGYRSRSANSYFRSCGIFVDYDNLNETCSIASGCGNIK